MRWVAAQALALRHQIQRTPVAMAASDSEAGK
jgi:hypothetical protein